MNKIITLLCVAAIFLFVACESSEPVENESGGLSIYLSLPPALSVDTRAGSIGGVSINDVWVVQFDADGKMLHAVCYDSTKISNFGTSGALVQVETGNFSDVSGTFRIIANFGESQSQLVAFSKNTNAQKVDLEGIVISYSNYKSQQNYLVSDDIEFKGTDTSGKAVLLAGLSYAYSWIDVKWTNKVASPARFTLQSITAYNLPESFALESRAGTTVGAYPAADQITNTYPVDTDATDNGLSVNGTYTFYMPENLRGVGCGKSFQEKNLNAYGPKTDGKAPTLGSDGKPEAGGDLSKCTYIDLLGSYWYSYNSADPTATSPISVRYRLYLGGNLVNDYNVRRGYHYTITVQISGANSGDVRVTITNGNVVVFDKVETIDKVVDF
ncbi:MULTISPECIES: DUF4906 domain-containing protein [Bacteroides]|jgi:hypothetical protein|uniref:DUF4906 domain-containing protein n=1 Tax=Bacteroides TaxID=816 RepID=UPI001F1BE8C7|nr:MULTISPECIES: DUF4906 domain-containing protein [Bacteroides]